MIWLYNEIFSPEFNLSVRTRMDFNFLCCNKVATIFLGIATLTRPYAGPVGGIFCFPY